LEEIYANLALRDYQDTTREESSIQTKDAIVLDNSNIDQAAGICFVYKTIIEQ
jgi:cytidylate kinase